MSETATKNDKAAKTANTIESVAKIAEVAAKTLPRLLEAAEGMPSKVNPEMKIVREFLHAVRKERRLRHRATESQRRGFPGIADNQQSRAAAWRQEADRLMPLVLEIVSPKADPQVALPLAPPAVRSTPAPGIRSAPPREEG